MKSVDLISYFWDKEEHYPISDEFIEKYQQLDDGKEYSYITYAHKTNHLANAEMHEPNQKWHLLESYFLRRLIEKENVDFSINGFKCPELLIWMAEAAGVDTKVVSEAAKYAKEKTDQIRLESPNKPYSAKAVENINLKLRKKYNKSLWDMIIEKVCNNNY